MANYIFETATDTGSFTSTDHLIFTSATASMVGATDKAAYDDSLGHHAESITLTAGDHSATFSAAALNYASGLGNVVFLNGDSLVLGTASGDTLVIHDAGHGHGTVTYGFDGDDLIESDSNGNDTINGGAGADTIYGSSSYTDATGHFVENDYYQGGAGNDSILGGDGNDHIYGNVAFGSAGTPDGDDYIYGGAGNDYVNGNAGNDTLFGGDGNDRLYGGNGMDTLSGDEGNDSLQGNLGNDALFGGNGNDTIHGGADSDYLDGGAGNDQLWGDLGSDRIYGNDGNDTIHGGAGYDSMDGGAGNDVFVFAAGDADIKEISSTVSGVLHHDVIDGFQDGTDHISLGFTVTGVVHGGDGVQFDSLAAAKTYAESQLNLSTGTHGTEVAALEYGGSMFLFWDDTHSGTTVNSMLEISGSPDLVINATGTHADFI